MDGIVRLNGPHGVGRTTTAALLQPLLPIRRSAGILRLRSIVVASTPAEVVRRIADDRPRGR